MKTKQKILLHLLLGISFIILGITLAYAQGAPLGLQTPEQVPSQFRTVEQIVKLIFNIAIYGSGITFIILFLVGGIQYLGAAGNEEALNKAKKLLINSVIGLIIVLSSWAIGTFIINALYGRVPSINIPSGPTGGGGTVPTPVGGEASPGTPEIPESTPTELPTIPDNQAPPS